MGEDAPRVPGVDDGVEEAGEAAFGDLVEQPARPRQHVERVQRRHAREVGELRRGGPGHEEGAGLFGVGARERRDQVGRAGLHFALGETDARARLDHLESTP